MYAAQLNTEVVLLSSCLADIPSKDMLIVGITGSYGKTTIGWLVRGIMVSRLHAIYTAETNNLQLLLYICLPACV